MPSRVFAAPCDVGQRRALGRDAGSLQSIARNLHRPLGAPRMGGWRGAKFSAFHYHIPASHFVPGNVSENLRALNHAGAGFQRGAFLPAIGICAGRLRDWRPGRGFEHALFFQRLLGIGQLGAFGLRGICRPGGVSVPVHSAGLGQGRHCGLVRRSGGHGRVRCWSHLQSLCRTVPCLLLPAHGA